MYVNKNAFNRYEIGSFEFDFEKMRIYYNHHRHHRDLVFRTEDRENFIVRCMEIAFQEGQNDVRDGVKKLLKIN